METTITRQAAANAFASQSRKDYHLMASDSQDQLPTDGESYASAKVTSIKAGQLLIFGTGERRVYIERVDNRGIVRVRIIAPEHVRVVTRETTQ